MTRSSQKLPPRLVAHLASRLCNAHVLFAAASGGPGAAEQVLTLMQEKGMQGYVAPNEKWSVRGSFVEVQVFEGRPADYKVPLTEVLEHTLSRGSPDLAERIKTAYAVYADDATGRQAPLAEPGSVGPAKYAEALVVLHALQQEWHATGPRVERPTPQVSFEM